MGGFTSQTSKVGGGPAGAGGRKIQGASMAASGQHSLRQLSRARAAAAAAAAAAGSSSASANGKKAHAVHSPEKAHAGLGHTFVGASARAPGGAHPNGGHRHANGGAAAAAASSVETVEAAPAQSSEYEMSTLTTWLLREEMRGQIDQELGIVLSSIAVACKQIASLVNRAGISNLTGLAGQENVQGEDQKKLDVVSNEVFCNCLRSCGRTGIIASEEEDVPVAVEETYSGNYIVVFDPLDGSSNIDAGISTGSIFGIYEPVEGCVVGGENDSGSSPEEVLDKCILNVCQPGSRLLASGYCMYSSSTVFVLTVGEGVFGFTLDPAIGEFVLTHANIKIPEEGRIYSFNEGNFASWEPQLQSYMSSLKAPPDNSKAYSSRYIGSLVGDFHRTMLYGGIYGYPGDSKNPNGKLRLLYECAPMSMIAEQAGGKGSTGRERPPAHSTSSPGDARRCPR